MDGNGSVVSQARRSAEPRVAGIAARLIPSLPTRQEALTRCLASAGFEQQVVIMDTNSIVIVVVIVLIVLFVLGYFGRGRFRG